MRIGQLLQFHYAALPPFVRVWILLWTLLVISLYVYNFVRCIQLGRDKTATMFTGISLTFLFVLYQIFAGQNTSDPVWNVKIPFGVQLLLLVSFSVAAYAQKKRISKWHHASITNMSVKESLDSLPTGLCFYEPSGLPRLTNTQMESLCRKLTGAVLDNGKMFWDKLRSGAYEGCVTDGEEPVYRLRDGQIYSFKRFVFLTSQGEVFELIASDVTQEYSLTEELEQKKKQAGYVNTRLKALFQTMEYVVMERELLNLKVALHDNIGRCLLYADRFLVDEEHVDKAELVYLWRQNISVLKNEKPEYWQKPYYISLKYATLLGVQVRVEGELPEEEHLLKVVDTAINVHVTNVMRHAEGTEAVITVHTSDNTYLLTFENNGKAPEGEVTENGGLLNLRREAERVGGSMRVQGIPRFRLELFLPKKITAEQKQYSKLTES
ncbi:MAG: hypothetical protein E7294_04100 [Lachnospiraceae bacterium]|nr:hypothetical protein [Lachnospiraceae bacterium]